MTMIASEMTMINGLSALTEDWTEEQEKQDYQENIVPGVGRVSRKVVSSRGLFPAFLRLP